MTNLEAKHGRKKRQMLHFQKKMNVLYSTKNNFLIQNNAFINFFNKCADHQ